MLSVHMLQPLPLDCGECTNTSGEKWVGIWVRPVVGTAQYLRVSIATQTPPLPFQPDFLLPEAPSSNNSRQRGAWKCSRHRDRGSTQGVIGGRGGWDILLRSTACFRADALSNGLYYEKEQMCLSKPISFITINLQCKKGLFHMGILISISYSTERSEFTASFIR